MIVAVPGCMASALLGMRDALMVANAWCLRASRPKMFSAHLVSLDPGEVLAFGDFPMKVEHVSPRVRPSALKNFARANALLEAKKRAKMSERSLNRRFKEATGDTMIAYLHKIRVEAAKRLLEMTRHNVSTITTHVGYEDERSFRRLFTRRAGISPREYRKRFAMR